MKHSRVLLLICLVGMCITATANAQFLWISVDRASEKTPRTNLYFEESAKPGDGHYLDHFLGKSDVWIRTVEQPSPAPIQAEEVKEGDNRWMRVAATVFGWWAVR